MQQTPTRRYRHAVSQAITVALGVAGLGTAVAQTASFNVPEQDAATAIPEFARQANLQIIAPADKLNGIKTHSRMPPAWSAITASSCLWSPPQALAVLWRNRRPSRATSVLDTKFRSMDTSGTGKSAGNIPPIPIPRSSRQV